MKRIVTAMAVLVATAGILSAGDVSVALEAKVNVWSKTGADTQGFNIVQGDDYLAQLRLGYDAEFGGGYIRLRSGEMNRNNIWTGKSPWTADAKSFGMDRWGMYIKPVKQFKFTISNAAYEVFAESINWEPIFGAGFFENSSAPHAVLELFPVDGLTIAGGITAEDEDTGSYGITDNPFSTFEGVVKYDIANIGSAALEFSNASKNDSGFGKDGDVKRIGAQFNYTGVDKLSVLAGYSAVIVSGDAFDDANDILDAAGETKLSSLAQNRLELFVTYSGIDKLTLSLYEAALLRGEGWGDFGNRLAVKVAYQATDKLSFWTRENLFMNYGSNNHGWGAYQLANSSDKDQKGLRAELYGSYDFGKGIGTYVGVRFDYDMTSEGPSKPTDDDARLTYSIPVGITVNY
ncbi:MAG TPA: hypothetical protein DCL73_00935 [Treponema sp.]|nr:hypothetical protein [Treponema sp.]